MKYWRWWWWWWWWWNWRRNEKKLILEYMDMDMGRQSRYLRQRSGHGATGHVIFAFLFCLIYVLFFIFIFFLPFLFCLFSFLLLHFWFSQKKIRFETHASYRMFWISNSKKEKKKKKKKKKKEKVISKKLRFLLEGLWWRTRNMVYNLDTLVIGWLFW